jgi:hypothetical protein
MRIENNFEIVNTKEEFDVLVDKYGNEIELSSSAEEERYEELDRILAERLNNYFKNKFGMEKEDFLFHQIWDWWPTCTRFFELSDQCLSSELLIDLQSYLVGVYKEWRINMVVYKSLDSYDDDYLGGTSIYSDRILITASLFDKIQNPDTGRSGSNLDL